MAEITTQSAGDLIEQVVTLKHMLGQFGRLIEISLTLNSTQDPDEILQFIIETATDILDCEAVSIMLYDEEQGVLKFGASTDKNAATLIGVDVPLRSIAGTIFQENRPLVINNVDNDPRHFQEVGEKIKFHSRSLVGVPMRIQEKVTGVLEALNKRNDTFTQSDVDILSVIANQAALAINNARLVSSLQNAYEELQSSDKMKSDFIAVSSHELRTPLFHILGYAQMLQEDTEGELNATAEKVMQSALKLRSLVEDMTNINLLKVGAQSLILKKAVLQKILAAAYTESLSTLQTKNHKVNISLPKDPIYVMADVEKLEQVFINVLNNSARFTERSGMIIIAIEQDEHAVVIKIKDNGIGIPPSQLEKIFEEFYQVEDHKTRVYGGMGLGLPIARGLLRLHNGTITAESEGIDKGSTFYITLPLATE